MIHAVYMPQTQAHKTRETNTLDNIGCPFCRFIEIQNQHQWFAVIFASVGCIAIVMESGWYYVD